LPDFAGVSVFISVT